MKATLPDTMDASTAEEIATYACADAPMETYFDFVPAETVELAATRFREFQAQRTADAAPYSDDSVPFVDDSADW